MLPRFLLLTCALSVAAAAVRIDTDGMLIIDGKREFLLGLYQPPKTADPLKEARAAGFRVVHSSSEAAQAARARAAGMFIWTTVGSIDPKNRRQSETAIRKVVESLKDDPAVLWFETQDEPSFVNGKPLAIRIPPEEIIATYDFVKRLDPNRILYLNHSPTNLVSTLRKYNGGTDIVAADIYPVVPHGIRESYALWGDGMQGDYSSDQINQVGLYADKMRAVAGPAKPVFMVLQGFAWEALREKDRDPKMVRYPTRDETRFMAYQSVIHGANGILYWGLPYAPPESGIWESIQSVARELAQLKPELSAPKATLGLRLDYHDTGHSLEKGIEWVAKPSADATLLVAANADKNPVDVTLSTPAGFRACEALFGARQPGFRRGAWRESFRPFEVRVWRLRR